MEIDEKLLLRYSKIDSIEKLKEEVMEWIDRSNRTSESGGYPNEFCANQIIMIFHCVLHYLREEYQVQDKGVKDGD